MIQPSNLAARATAEEVDAGYAGTVVLVLGAAGFIGRWVVRALSAAGARVHATTRDPARARAVLSAYGAEGILHVVDAARAGEVRELVLGVRPSIVFNLAGYGVDPAEREARAAFSINAGLPARLCGALGDAGPSDWPGVRIVHVGSAQEYGRAGGALAEETPPCPTTLYGRSKLAGTLRLQRTSRRRGVHAVTARLFTVYGPGEATGRLLPSLLRTARRRQPLSLTAGQQLRDFTYVEDVAAGLLRLGLSQGPAAETVNLATGTLTSVRAFVEAAARVLPLSPELLRFGELPTREDEMDHAPVRLRRLRERTGWSPSTTPEEGIERTVAFETSAAAEAAATHAVESHPLAPSGPATAP